MSATMHMFACDCGRCFVEHTAVKPSAICPACGGKAKPLACGSDRRPVPAKRRKVIKLFRRSA